MDQIPSSSIEYYGVSPWEVEVLYECLRTRFNVVQKEIEFDQDSKYVSMIHVNMPVSFSDEFFKWFGFRNWDRIKFLFKEIKRRRGNKKSIKLVINFNKKPEIEFIIDVQEGYLYNAAVEKIDLVLELLQYHLSDIPQEPIKILYKFDTQKARWIMSIIHTYNQKFIRQDDTWQVLKP